MTRSPLRRATLSSLIVWASLTLAGCPAASVEGTYESPDQQARLELKSGNKAVFTVGGEATETTWAMEGKDKVLLHGTMGSMEFTIGEGGNLVSPMGMLNKKK